MCGSSLGELEGLDAGYVDFYGSGGVGWVSILGVGRTPDGMVDCPVIPQADLLAEVVILAFHLVVLHEVGGVGGQWVYRLRDDAVHRPVARVVSAWLAVFSSTGVYPEVFGLPDEYFLSVFVRCPGVATTLQGNMCRLSHCVNSFSIVAKWSKNLRKASSLVSFLHLF